MLHHYLNTEDIAFAMEHGFDATGLRFPVQDIQKIKPHGLSMEALAEYVDAVTFVKVHHGDIAFLEPMLEPPVTPMVNLSITGLGNIAYTALHMKDDACREKAKALYQRLKLSVE